MESLRSSAISAREESESLKQARASKDEAILTLLAQLALVYWRPDFEPGQARQLYAMFLADLRDYSLADINEAIRIYRRDPESKFYPTPGQLRGLIEAVPAWDVISKAKHIAQCREASRAELEAVAGRLVSPPVRISTS